MYSFSFFLLPTCVSSLSLSSFFSVYSIRSLAAHVDDNDYAEWDN